MNNLLISILIGVGSYLLLSRKEKFTQYGGSDIINTPFTTYSTKTLGYIENNRQNSNYGNYPPCFDLCGASRIIFDILEKNSLVEKYKPILEAQSILLCQEKFLNVRLCYETMIENRLQDLANLGIPRNYRSSQLYRKHIEQVKNILGKQYIKTGPDALELLIRVTIIIENQLEQIKNDENLSNEDINKIEERIKQFYSNHYELIAKGC
jgi:hypothetical protein